MATSLKPYLQTGGLLWHWRAWRRSAEWAACRHWLAHALNPACTPATANDTIGDMRVKPSPYATFDMEPLLGGQPLLVCGPSAGWTLPRGFWRAATSLVCIDMDPLARYLFAKNHPNIAIPVVWLRQDFMQTHTELCERWPDGCLLFANSLGQQGLLSEHPAQTEQAFAVLSAALAGRTWFSYHDRISVHCSHPVSAAAVESLNQSLSTLVSDGPMAVDRLTETLHPLRTPGQQWQITDHLTTHLLPNGSQRRYCALRLTRHAVHILEAGWSFPGSRAQRNATNTSEDGL